MTGATGNICSMTWESRVNAGTRSKTTTMKRLQIVRSIAILVLAGGFSLLSAQSFPFDDFRPRTLAEIVRQNIAVEKDSMKGVQSKQQMIIDADPLPSLVRVTYTGKWRPASEGRKNYLKLWIDSFKKDRQANQIYDVEMLVSEGPAQYWLLVQKQLIPSFEKECKQGEPVDLYLIRMGGFLTDSGWDWMFIVEEFHQPGSPGGGFPWNDFERRTLGQLIKIDNDEDADELKRFPDQNRMVMRGKILSSVVRVIYTGQCKPVSAERKKFLELWAGTYSSTPDYAALFETECLFKEGTDGYWLPVQKQVASYFGKELQTDETIDIYLIRPGGLRINNKADWVFLVEEFQKPKK
jgi:hypothetical protein